MASLTLPFSAQVTSQDSHDRLEPLRDRTNIAPQISSDATQTHGFKPSGLTKGDGLCYEHTGAARSGYRSPFDEDDDDYEISSPTLVSEDPIIGSEAEKAFEALFRPHGLLLDPITERNSSSTLNKHSSSALLDRLSLRRLRHRKSAPATFPTRRSALLSDRSHPLQTYPKANARPSDGDDMSNSTSPLSSRSTTQDGSSIELHDWRRVSSGDVNRSQSPGESRSVSGPSETGQTMRTTSSSIREIFTKLTKTAQKIDLPGSSRHSPRGRVVSPYTVNHGSSSSDLNPQSDKSSWAWNTESHVMGETRRDVPIDGPFDDDSSIDLLKYFEKREKGVPTPEIWDDASELPFLSRVVAKDEPSPVSPSEVASPSPYQSPDSPVSATRQLLTPQPLSISKSRFPWKRAELRQGRNIDDASILPRCSLIRLLVKGLP
ncbi:MAG: hypothetical protein M1828_001302 [Chrysothrix sp. TS-e1954]|nr:MAG: hypothetical protein M1828_001302 [Chrysothrix sp. TS-e1954]